MARTQLHYNFTKDGKSKSMWSYMCKSFLVFLFKLIMVYVVVIVILGLQISLQMWYFWLGSVVVLSVITIGVWSAASRGNLLSTFLLFTSATNPDDKEESPPGSPQQRKAKNLGASPWKKKCASSRVQRSRGGSKMRHNSPWGNRS